MSTQERRDIELLQSHDKSYANGRPKISDAAYDKLRERLRQKYPRNKYFAKVGAPLKAKGRVEIKLPLRMGSLEKKRPTEAVAWINSLPKGAEIYVEPKWDGLAIECEYHNGEFRRAFTRGEDGVTGFDVTENVRHIQGVLNKFVRVNEHSPAKATAYVQGEVVIHKRLFAKHYQGKSLEPNGRPYKAARNFCIGMINRLSLRPVHIKALRHMTFISYGFVREVKGQREYFDKAEAMAKLSFHGFTTSTLPVRHGGKFRPLENFWYPQPNKITVQLLNSLLQQWREKYDVQQDGLVIQINQHKLRQKYGFDNPRPGYAYAIKPEAVDQTSLDGVVKQLDIQMSSRRILIPVWVLQNKLNFDGVEVDRITAHNCDELVHSQAGPGAIIKIVRSGDVIPRYISTVKSAKVELPKRCPHCQTKLQWTTNRNTGRLVHLYCPNERCPGPYLRMLRRFFTVLKVDGMAKGVIEAMVNAGLNSISKILTATPQQLRKVEGFGERKTEKIREGLRELVKSVSLAKLMKASNCFADETMGFGERRFEPIIQQLGRQTILAGAINKSDMINKLLQVPGVGQRVAEQFVEGLPAFRAFYRQLTNIVQLAKDKKLVGGKLAGKVFTFTGWRPDAAMQKKIESNGGAWNDSYSSRTTTLFAGSLTTGKAIKAAENGTKIVLKNTADNYLDQLLEKTR